MKWELEELLIQIIRTSKQLNLSGLLLLFTKVKREMMINIRNDDFLVFSRVYL